MNLDRVQSAIDARKLDANVPVTIASLAAAGVIGRVHAGVRLLGKGELKSKLDFEVHHASKSAIAAVERAGGTVKVLKPVPAPAADSK